MRFSIYTSREGDAKAELIGTSSSLPAAKVMAEAFWGKWSAAYTELNIVHNESNAMMYTLTNEPAIIA